MRSEERADGLGLSGVGTPPAQTTMPAPVADWDARQEKLQRTLGTFCPDHGGFPLKGQVMQESSLVRGGVISYY
jgi:hypothetical protein